MPGENSYWKNRISRSAQLGFFCGKSLHPMCQRSIGYISSTENMKITKGVLKYMTINRCNNCNEQQHVHEIIGITETIVNGCEGHNHRIATVSGEAIETCNNHVHEVIFRTDFADGHYHEFCGTSEDDITAVAFDL